MFATARRRVQVQPVIRPARLPAPVGGLNAIAAGSAMPLSDCLALYNMRPAEYGLRTRFGYREWVTGLVGASDSLVRTVIPYSGSARAGTGNRLFAATSAGIFDVTTSVQKWEASTAYVIGDVVMNDTGKIYTCDQNGTSAASGGPTGNGANIADGTARWDYTSTRLKLAFGTTTGDAGRGVACAVTTAAGVHYLLYADEVNGLIKYTESTDTWAAVAMGGGAGQISGVDPATICFVAAFKNRVWLVRKDTASAYYLDAGAVAGAATEFNFGPQFKAGGSLIGLWHWTYDGGSGIDDALVAISAGGDVAIYKGTDPDNANAFGLDGVWQVGDMPAGRKVCSELGGDLLVLTRTGILPLSRLVVGAQLDAQQYSTFKIGPLFNQLMLSRATFEGWSIRLHPEDGTMVVTVPEGTSVATGQLVMSLGPQKGWARDRDLPVYSSDVWGGKLYFGTIDGRVCINDGCVDGVTLADPDASTPIQWAVLTAFSDLGTPQQKQLQTAAVQFLSEGAVSFDIEARYNFDQTELATVTLDGSGGESDWDTATWDAAVWGGEYAAVTEIRGLSGMGRFAALALRGAAASRTVLVDVSVGYTLGGPL